MISEHGVPLELDPNKPRLILPVAQHRFQLKQCSEQITQNVMNAKFNFADKTLTVNVRITVDPASFDAAMTLAEQKTFAVDLMTGGTDRYYRVQPENLKLVEHNLSFDYSVSAPAFHQYKWTYTNITVVPNEALKAPEPIQQVDDDGFVTPAEALDSYMKKGLTNGRQLLNEVPVKPFRG